MKNKSFTLIELLVVIVIIGILAGVIIVSVSSSINKANFAKAQSFSNTVQNELLGDLVSEWTFDIASNPGEDTWGNNDGTVYGATYKTKADGVCVYGGCMSFDGNDYINCGNNSDLNLTNSFTLSTWIKIAGYLTEDSIAVIWKEAQFGLRVEKSSRESRGYIFTSSWSAVSGPALSSDLWYHLVLEYDGAYGRIYTNGVSSQNYLMSKPSQQTYPFQIGIQGGSRWFNGLIDDVRIYNSALSSAQIKQEYVAGLDSLLANGNISKEEYDERINSLALYND